MAVKNPLKPYLDKVPAPFKNKYFLILVIFFAWMVFFDKQDILTQWKLARTLKRLETDRTYYSQKIEEAERTKEDMRINLEKYARERYFVKRGNEEVFIIKRK